jgi:hypothetical protein
VIGWQYCESQSSKNTLPLVDRSVELGELRQTPGSFDDVIEWLGRVSSVASVE